MKYKITDFPQIVYNKIFADIRRSKWYARQVEKNPRLAVNIKWLALNHKLFPWDNPQTSDEKIAWLQVNTDTSLWTQLADKYEVRKYVEEKVGGGGILIPCYGVWDRVEDIDFDSLPNEFVIKCTHDSGSTHIVRDKSKENIEALRQELRKYFDRKIGHMTFEPHYLKIKPRIMAEKLLVNDGNFESTSLVDYKMFCFDGEPYKCLICYDRHRKEDGHVASVLDIYSLSPWTHTRDDLVVQNKNFRDFPEPANLNIIIDVCRKLSKGFPQVRIDLYNVNGHVYFGEMTFTDGSGINNDCYTKAAMLEMGKRITLPKHQ